MMCEYGFIIGCAVEGLNVTSTGKAITIEKNAEEKVKRPHGFGPTVAVAVAVTIAALAIVASLAEGSRRR